MEGGGSGDGADRGGGRGGGGEELASKHLPDSFICCLLSGRTLVGK